MSLLVSLCDFIFHEDESIQMERESGYYLALKQLQEYQQAKIQQECELNQETQELERKYKDHYLRLAKRHEEMREEMVEEGNIIFQEIFSMMDTTDSIKLLPWCTSSTIPFCFLSEHWLLLHNEVKVQQLLLPCPSWRNCWLWYP